MKRGGQPIAHYQYDSAGNRSLALSGRSSYGAGGVLLTSPQGRYEHDELGRPTRLEGRSGGTAYSYDDLGRLVRVGLPESGSVEFLYDALYRRRTKTTPTGIRRTVWAGDVPLEESLPDGGSIKYLYDPVSEAPLAVEIGGEWHYVVRDGHGDITDVIRARDETVVWSAEPLGFETSIVIDDLPEPFPLRGFGQMFDSETGLVYQRARYYAPHEGRFLTPDPIGPAGGPNPYSSVSTSLCSGSIPSDSIHASHAWSATGSGIASSRKARRCRHGGTRCGTPNRFCRSAGSRGPRVGGPRAKLWLPELKGRPTLEPRARWRATCPRMIKRSRISTRRSRNTIAGNVINMKPKVIGRRCREPGSFATSGPNCTLTTARRVRFQLAARPGYHRQRLNDTWQSRTSLRQTLSRWRRSIAPSTN